MSMNPFDTRDSSELVFGYIDETRFTGELEWHPVISK
jgi:hypothetical protein